MNLKILQEKFQSYLLNNDSQIAKNIKSSQQLTSAQQIQIYQNSYHERMIAALSQDFPILRAILGENAFSSLVRDYMSHYPSEDFNLRHVGKNLSDFIISKDHSLRPYSELAKLEYAMCMANASQEIAFESDFNVVEVYHHFHRDNQLIPIKSNV
jgi:hypothetical protein